MYVNFPNEFDQQFYDSQVEEMHDNDEEDLYDEEQDRLFLAYCQREEQEEFDRQADRYLAEEFSTLS
jgi:hypothetical protein